MVNTEIGILIIGIVQGLFLVITLATKTASADKANRYLVFLLLAFVVALSTQLVIVSGYVATLKHELVIASSIVWLFGPLLYFYVASLTSASFTISYSALFHLIPWGIYLIFVVIATFFSNATLEISADIALKNYTLTQLTLPLLKLIHVVCYTVACLIMLVKYARRIEDTFSNIENINLLWLRNLVIGFILFEGSIAITLVLNVSGVAAVSNADTILSCILVVLIFMTGFYGMQQPAISDTLIELDDNCTIETPIHDYATTHHKNLRPSEVTAIETKISELMLQKVYLDRFLSLKKLSDLVGVSNHKMSEFLNTHLKMTFYEYINKARVDDAKLRLHKTSAPILDIALDVGFNNKATFNKSFKHLESITPSEFRRLKSQEKT